MNPSLITWVWCEPKYFMRQAGTSKAKSDVVLSNMSPIALRGESFVVIQQPAETLLASHVA